MLKSPFQYINCETSISSRPVRVSGETYGSAVIFFTPKIGDRNIDLTTLTCEFVQIVDRGEWGKEEVSYSVEASSSSNRKYREFSFENDCDSYELKFIPPPGLKLGIIEVFFDPDTIYTNSSTMSPSNNPYVPQSLTAADITAGMVAAAPQIATAVGVESRAAMAAQFDKETAKNTNEILVTVKAWSGNVANHIVLPASTTRLGVKSSNQGNNNIYINAGTPSSPAALQFGNYDDIMNKGGTWYALDSERLLPLVMYLDAGKPDQQVSITELLP
jgi:hypothetical protein